MRSETQLRQTIAHIVCDMEKVASGGTAAWRQLLMRVAVVPLRRALEAPPESGFTGYGVDPASLFAPGAFKRAPARVACPVCGSPCCDAKNTAAEDHKCVASASVRFTCPKGHLFYFDFGRMWEQTIVTVRVLVNTDYDFAPGELELMGGAE